MGTWNLVELGDLQGLICLVSSSESCTQFGFGGLELIGGNLELGGTW